MAPPDGMTLREHRVGESPLHMLSHRCEADGADAGDLSLRPLDTADAAADAEAPLRGRIAKAAATGEAAAVLRMLDASVMKLRAAGWTLLRGIEPADAADAEQPWSQRRWLDRLPELA